MMIDPSGTGWGPEFWRQSMTILSQWPKLGYGTSPMDWWSAMNFEWASIFSDAKLHKYLANNTGQCSDRLLRGSILSDYLITILTKTRRFTKENDWKGEPWNWMLLSLEKHNLQWCAQIDHQVIKNWTTSIFELLHSCNLLSTCTSPLKLTSHGEKNTQEVFCILLH